MFPKWFAGRSPSSSTMVASPVVLAFRLAVTAAGGTPSGGEEGVIQEARDRFNKVASNDVVKCALVSYALVPVAQYANNHVPGLLSKTPVQYSDFIFELLEVVARFTHIMKRHETVFQSEECWAIVSASLGQIQQGFPPQRRQRRSTHQPKTPVMLGGRAAS